MEYYLIKDDQQQGPFTINQMRSMWNAGTIHGKTLWWQEGMSEWLECGIILDILEPKAPNPIPRRKTPTNVYQPSPNQPSFRVVKTAKSRGIYVILGIFLGGMGIHNFYAGRYGSGVFELIMNLIAGTLFAATSEPMIHGCAAFLVLGIFILILFELITVTADSAGDPLL